MVAAGAVAGATLFVVTPAWAADAVPLGAAESYGVLAGQAVTDVPPPVGPSTINGDLGVWPGTSVTGAPEVNGDSHVGDTAAEQAQTALTAAYDFAAGQPTTATVSADLGGQTLVGGAYRSPATMALTGTLTLDGQNDPDSVFIFQVGSDLVTAVDSQVSLIRGAQACNVFWQVTSSATLNTRSDFVGSILALQSATLGEGVTVAGRVLARNGNVTLINDTITRPFCAAAVIEPPVISKAFADPAIPLDGSTSLSFTITNPNIGTALTGVGFTDVLPAGMVVTTPSGGTGSCGGGTITATAGSRNIGLAGATLPAGGSCTFAVDVTGTTLGAKVNTSGPVTSTNGGPGNPATARLAVGVPVDAPDGDTAPPTISKAFGDTTIAVGGTTSLRFTLRNRNSGTALTGVGFTDRLPAGLVLARPLGLTGTCGGGTITATAGGRNIGLTGATLRAGQSCTFAVNVTGTTSGMKTNTTAVVISVESGPGPRASSRIRVGDRPPGLPISDGPPGPPVSDGPPGLPVTGSPGSTYVTTAIVTVGIGVLFLTIGRRKRF